MRKLHTRNGGFTLIELMIVVAIIGILAAIAIPNFLRFQLRSRVGEGKTNIAAIRTAEEAYAAEYATYVGAAPLPNTGLSGDKQSVVYLAPELMTTGAFDAAKIDIFSLGTQLISATLLGVYSCTRSCSRSKPIDHFSTNSLS